MKSMGPSIMIHGVPWHAVAGRARVPAQYVAAWRWRDCRGPVGTGPRQIARFYLGQILKIVPVPGIWTSGPLAAPTYLISGLDWPKSRTAP
jgi:hypothetical protein